MKDINKKEMMGVKLTEKILPRKITDNYSGNDIAKWAFYALTIFTIIRSLIHTFAADGGAQSIATIPLDTYSAAAAATVILIFSLWGLSQLLMGLFYGIVSLRYKSLIPLMYCFMIVEYIMRIILGQLKPIETVGTAPGGIGSYILVPVLIILLLLSLNEKKVDDD